MRVVPIPVFFAQAHRAADDARETPARLARCRAIRGWPRPTLAHGHCFAPAIGEMPARPAWWDGRLPDGEPKPALARLRRPGQIQARSAFLQESWRLPAGKTKGY